MVFREADRVEAQIFGFLGQFDHFADHPLPAVGMIGNWAELAALVKRRGERGQKEVHEFHSGYLDSVSYPGGFRLYLSPIAVDRPSAARTGGASFPAARARETIRSRPIVYRDHNEASPRSIVSQNAHRLVKAVNVDA